MSIRANRFGAAQITQNATEQKEKIPKSEALPNKIPLVKGMRNLTLKTNTDWGQYDFSVLIVWGMCFLLNDFIGNKKAYNYSAIIEII